MTTYVERVQPLPTYEPSYNAYETMIQTRLRTHTEQTSTPEGFPSVSQGPHVWHPDVAEADRQNWVFELNEECLGHIAEALNHAKDKGILLRKLTKNDFPLPPPLSTILAALKDRVYYGMGFGLLRGLKLDGYSMQDKVYIQAGLLTYIGGKRAYIAPKGSDVLSHVRDLAGTFGKEKIKSPSYTNNAMTFHTDLGDIVSLFTLEKGAGGGSFRVASSGQVYNVLAERSPKVLHTLSQDFHFDTLEPNVPNYKQPLLFNHGGRVFLQSFRRPFTGFHNFTRSADIDPISSAQVNALDELHFTAMENSLSIEFETGDMMIVDNLSLLHARDKFDTPSQVTEGAKQRHLIKMFLKDDTRHWELPGPLQTQWERLFEDRLNDKGERMENFPVMWPTALENSVVPNSGWSQNG